MTVRCRVVLRFTLLAVTVIPSLYQQQACRQREKGQDITASRQVQCEIT